MPLTADAEPTGSGPFFFEQATRLERELASDPSERGRALAAEAHRLAELFGQWENVRPDPELKATAVRDLFELNRAAMEHLGALSGVHPSQPRLPDVAGDD